MDCFQYIIRYKHFLLFTFLYLLPSVMFTFSSIFSLFLSIELSTEYIFKVGVCNGNATAATEYYRQRFLNCSHLQKSGTEQKLI